MCYNNDSFSHRVDFSFKRFISKQQPASPTVSFRDGNEVKLGVPDMCSDGRDEMQPSVSQNFYFKGLKKVYTHIISCT